MPPKQMTPIHEDRELTREWWEDRGFVMGRDVFYNSIRDASGRYNGFVYVVVGSEPAIIKTVEAAMAAIAQQEKR